MSMMVLHTTKYDSMNGRKTAERSAKNSVALAGTETWPSATSIKPALVNLSRNFSKSASKDSPGA
ncbi:MAG: hypothetical protein BWX66_01803 [Deltaproteobacteria bacterium ADurb.Bin058]|nr:MAG: hypothetical protein BWX66_01803 [Deltaproteobacteria bacterium ADurb.Bin058]